jgi:hypothetical protein
MPYQATVMIASPGDVADERMIVRDVIQDWNAANSKHRGIVLQAIGWDSHSYPSMEDHPQGVLNKQILVDADPLIAVFWTRLGTPTKDAVSGTVEEIARHVAAGRHAMIYFSDRDIPRHRLEQVHRLNDFRTQWMTRGLIETYKSYEEFKDKFSQQLAMTINHNPQFVAQRSSIKNDLLASLPQFKVPDIKQSLLERKRDELSAEARDLLSNAAVDRDGRIMRSETKDGLEIVTSGRNFVPEDNPRDRARWDAALHELFMTSLVSVVTYDEVYEVSDEGYQMVDLLNRGLEL